MLPNDQVFTPPNLARSLISHLPEFDEVVVADYAAGAGELLVSARDRWPLSTIIGFDIDPSLVRRLRRRFDKATFKNTDFLKINLKSFLNSLPKLPNVIVLNPPFSVRSRGLVCVEFSSKEWRASIALAFLAKAVDSLNPGGVAVAILPSGVLSSERDTMLLSEIKQLTDFEVLEPRLEKMFKGYDISCSIVRAVKRKRRKKLISPPTQAETEIQVQRGGFDHLSNKSWMRRSNNHPVRLIHTTNLSDRKLAGQIGWVDTATSGCEAPVIIFPRVGRIRQDKVILLEDASNFSFSKCLMVLSGGDYHCMRGLQAHILEDWENFLDCYGGTGAQYTTILKITKFVRDWANESDNFGTPKK